MARRQMLERSRVADVVAALGPARLGEMLDSLDDRVAGIAATIRAIDLALPPNLERDLHKLRGSAASLGLVEVATAIAEVERRVRHLGSDASREAALQALARDAGGLVVLVAEARAAMARLVPGSGIGKRAGNAGGPHDHGRSPGAGSKR